MENGSVQFWTNAEAPKKFAAFVESHVEAVTQLSFHPLQPEKYIVSASEDGLLCVFDLSVGTREDDALLHVANAGSSISRFGFFGPGLSCVWCVTATETLALWRVDDDCDEIQHFKNIREEFRRLGLHRIDYLVECLYDAATCELSLLVGDHGGSMHLLRVTPQSVSPLYSFRRCQQGHTSTVRCITQTSFGLITGGDDGLLCVWPRKRVSDLQSSGGDRALRIYDASKRGGVNAEKNSSAGHGRRSAAGKISRQRKKGFRPY